MEVNGVVLEIISMAETAIYNNCNIKDLKDK